jgi:hypothetical protein
VVDSEIGFRMVKDGTALVNDGLTPRARLKAQT